MSDRAKVLFIDDDNGKRYVLARAMRHAGFGVDEAATGAEGLAKVSPELDLIVLDIRLPDMHGWDIASRLKAAPETSTIMILELSATLATAQDRAHGLDRGADAYLVHPVEVVELLAVMRALVRLRRSERERERQRELFLATIGHDLRNPLDILATGTRRLAVTMALSARDPKPVERLDRATTRMKQLLDQMLVFTQGVAGGVPVEATSTDLAEVTRAAVRDIATVDRDITIHDHLGMHVVCDAHRLAQVVENLVTNALRHGEGPITVTLSRDDARRDPRRSQHRRADLARRDPDAVRALQARPIACRRARARLVHRAADRPRARRVGQRQLDARARDDLRGPAPARVARVSLTGPGPVSTPRRPSPGRSSSSARSGTPRNTRRSARRSRSGRFRIRGSPARRCARPRPCS